MSKLTYEEIFEKYPNLVEHLKQRSWAPITAMMIPSILKTADEYIKALEEIGTKDAIVLREQLIFYRNNFRRDL